MNSEQDLLIELKKGSSPAFEILYKQYFKMIASLITKLGGKQADIEDVFQETLFVLVKNIREPEFELTSKISTYMHSIARNIWLKKSQKGNKEMAIEDEELMNISYEMIHQDEDFEEKELMIGVVFDKINSLDDDCKNVIRLTFLKKLSHAEVADILGYTVAFMKVKKFRCLKYLRDLVITSPFFKKSNY